MRFYHFYVFFASGSAWRENYCKVERFILKIENFKKISGKFLKCAKKNVMCEIIVDFFYCQMEMVLI